jgi:hypothetical protein
MTDNDSAKRLTQRSMRFIAGAALICGAGVLGLAGIGLTTAAVVSSVRARMNRMPVPPRDLARQTWRQAKAATSAGRDAWRDGTILAPAPDGNRSTISAR